MTTVEERMHIHELVDLLQFSIKSRFIGLVWCQPYLDLFNGCSLCLVNMLSTCSWSDVKGTSEDVRC